VFIGELLANVTQVSDVAPGPLVSAMRSAIALKLFTWLYIYDLQIKFKDGCYQPILGRVMPLELGHFKGFYSFPDFFAQCLKLLH
jgi:hypothetical protein